MKTKLLCITSVLILAILVLPPGQEPRAVAAHQAVQPFEPDAPTLDITTHSMHYQLVLGLVE